MTNVATKVIVFFLMATFVRESYAYNTGTLWKNIGAFAALKDDGSVVTWGSAAHGGDSSSVSSLLSGGVSVIYSSWGAFAALKTDGSVVTWGDAEHGRDYSSLTSTLSG